ncbi:hypothetical protein [Aquimarina celericrescens]|uniref:Uncharacterized protein n=1 Tax=Aquimarina celericrescens TaxID=1964542 RepID=A0ABW5AUT5_9FLAO|nr:hypothetical protein [Aquimarina celericrescens]
MKPFIPKTVILCITILFFQTASAQVTDIELQELKGEWKLDMSPQDTTDKNFAVMRINEIDRSSVKGTFYREGVKIKEGRVNIQLGIIYVALVSGDNSGIYNTAFYYKDDKLYGTTHAVDRGFLSVWIAQKQPKN